MRKKNNNNKSWYLILQYSTKPPSVFFVSTTPRIECEPSGAMITTPWTHWWEGPKNKACGLTPDDLACCCLEPMDPFHNTLGTTT